MLLLVLKAAFPGKFTSNLSSFQHFLEKYMQIARRPLRRAVLFIGLIASLCLPALAADRSRSKG